jgi:hypothetical protein
MPKVGAQEQSKMVIEEIIKEQMLVKLITVLTGYIRLVARTISDNPDLTRHTTDF